MHVGIMPIVSWSAYSGRLTLGRGRRVGTEGRDRGMIVRSIVKLLLTRILGP